MRTSSSRRPPRAAVGALVVALSFLRVDPVRAQLPAAPDWPTDRVHPHRQAEAQRKAQQLRRLRAHTAKLLPDPNQALWDQEFVALDLRFDPPAQSVGGTVDFRLRVVTGPLTAVVLDLDDALTPTTATVGGNATGFTHSLDRLTVDLDRSYASGETIDLSVHYSGVPDASLGAFGFDDVNGSTLVWSLSEPFGARSWWPCKDSPSDKADSASIRLTVPSTHIAVSNGTLEQVVDLGNERRYEWKERHPIATYLISIAAYPYTEQSVSFTSGTGATVPVPVWSWPSQASLALTAAQQTVQMLGVFEQDFGPYPFADEKYGQAQFDWGGGMEHQTATSLGFWQFPFLLAHELAHQWFGDLVTCASFTDIWVNEGFATYSEALWDESQGGSSAYLATMRDARYLGPGTVRVPESSLDDTNRIFDSGLSYDKGAWVLHMLRGLLGDADFFAFLRAYASDPQVSYGVATTADVQRVAEAISGQDLSAFFTQWIDVPWYPTYRLDWSSTPAAGGFDVAVDLVQLQNHYVFTMPVPLRIQTTSGSTDVTVLSDQAVSSEVFHVNEAPVAVELDPDDWVLHAEEPAISAPSFDRGILLVNGVAWSVYGNEITSAYADSAFTGHFDFEFWDLFSPPSGGYVPALPPPAGQGPIPPEVLGRYSTVVWIGNDYQGDLGAWIDAAILSYLQQGGNVLLMTRRGRSFLTQLRLEYLGSDFATAGNVTVGAPLAALPGLVSIGLLGPQGQVSPLSTVPLQPETTVLFTDGNDPSRALGVWRRPAAGGSFRRSGAHFAHLAARPYRLEHTSLRQNTDTILGSLFGEPFGAVATDPISSFSRARWESAIPNPFNPRVRLRYRLPHAGALRIELFDSRGRRVRSVRVPDAPAGVGSWQWDGTDGHGRAVASGVYTAVLLSGGDRDRIKLTLVR